MVVDVSSLTDAVIARGIELADAGSQIALEESRRACPVSTPTPTSRTEPGRLRDDLRELDRSDDVPILTRTIGSELAYAAFTDSVDTAPHLIAATNAPVLRFWWDRGPGGPGIYHFRYVNHPGTRGQRWFSEPMPDRWAQALQQAAR